MSGQQSANIHSVDALRDVRAALILFQERSTTALSDLRQKIERTVAWLELDRPNYWKEQERRAYDRVATTRTAFETCRLRTVAGHRSDCIEEKKAFERAKMRMEYVREKQEVTWKWMVEASREANEYRARTSTLQRTLDFDVPLMIAQLGRMIDALEGYTNQSPPVVVSSPLLPPVETQDETAGHETQADPAINEVTSAPAPEASRTADITPSQEVSNESGIDRND
ncbi:hypothetical protein [Schlesneria sp. T3-172]|uniref:hypothetical protein n=1 Tax=Schlesneria sphaerica TaxID=3373610 RepID=UPI0037C696A8